MKHTINYQKVASLLADAILEVIPPEKRQQGQELWDLVQKHEPKTPRRVTAIYPQAVTISDAAKILGISTTTFYKLMKKGRLPLEFRILGKRMLVLTRSIEKALAL